MVKRFVYVALGAAIASGAGLLACNGVLGIDKATLLPSEAGVVVVDAGPDAQEAGPMQNPNLTCPAYCQLMAQECTGNAAEYIPDHPEVCSQICAQFAVVSYGLVDDTNAISLSMDDDPSQFDASAPTLNCRLWHANFAITTGLPAEHCPHAGPLGGEKCGVDPCPIFCKLQNVACATAQYATIADCMNACEPDAGGYPGYPYTVGTPAFEGGVATNLTGPTLDCRMYHVEAALKNDPSEGPSFHCPHTGNPSLNSDGTPGPCQ